MSKYKHYCDYCQKEYEDYFPSSHYCSRACYRLQIEASRKYKQIICPICNKEFYPTRSYSKYCSNQCKSKSQRKRVVCKCDYCGIEFERIVSDYNKKAKHYCSAECKRNGLWWNDEDTMILRDNYKRVPYKEMVNMFSEKKSIDSIRNRAIYIGLTAPRNWSNKEIEILKENYSKIPLVDVQKILPHRTLKSIISQARIQHLLSYFYLTNVYSQDDDDFLKENYIKMSNAELALKLHRNENGIAQHLLCLGLHRPREIDKYLDVSRYIRARLAPWKENYKKQNNYTCAISNKKSNIVVHHIRSFNLILNEAINNIQFPAYENMSMYTGKQLDELFNEYMNLQDYYGQYICVNEDIHIQFHRMFGYGNNTLEQWNEFLKSYNNK